MKIKKNIDDLFKESFENLEVSPSPEVWKNIQTKLKKEDDRKVIPIWIKLSGIAALLVLFFTIGNSLLNDSPNQTVTPIVFENKLNTKFLNETLQESTPPMDKTKANEDDYDAGITNKNTTEVDNSNSKVIIANHKKFKESANPQNNSGELNNKIATSEIASAKPVSNNKSPQKDFINKEITVVTANESATAVQNSNNSKVENADQEKIENKKSIFDVINETQEESTAIIVDNSPDNRWELIPNIAPVYYNTLSEGSSIDPMFSDNNKKGDLNVSYGIKVSYNLNKRVSIRSGVGNVNLSYSTTGLDIGTGPLSSAPTTSIDYYARNNVTIVVDKGALTTQNPNNPFENVTPKSTNGETYLNQKLSYYEMPLELNYAIINKKFGINVIGGFSTLILGNNEISVEAGDFNEVLGEASNLSPLSFTTNIGLGLNYSFSKKLMFIVEPMFKYQLNPYTDSSVNFKPYYLGVYSGLSFKF